jgi:hypothetical protein
MKEIFLGMPVTGGGAPQSGSFRMRPPAGLFLDVAWQGIEDPHGPHGGAVADCEFGQESLIEAPVLPAWCRDRECGPVWAGEDGR